MKSGKKNIAQKYLQHAFELYSNGKIEEAKINYKMSLQIYPTAEAHVYLGRIYSQEQDFDNAIRECYNAVLIDNDLGQAYNDIGSYLVKMNRLNESIVWFERAIESNNYSKKHLAYYNLGLVYTKKGLWFTAVKLFRQSIETKSDFKPAKNELYRILTFLN